ncbi:hypothetical protein [Rhodococcus qingshengii]|uniref:hypothetical protein n=1 Tax=Rhodococcus qingshengii TaxID=334542 RepID=UPI001C8CBF6C|nr:hypothetical protein [Rhodococcus qingshengii]MBX9150054.1 hypothetical protein [Rhodococcus qingshengii]
MTTALRHPQLDHKERAALESLGVPLDDPNLTITITWDDSWRTIGTGFLTNIPHQWTADVTFLVNEGEANFGLDALENGPRDSTPTVYTEDVQGTLCDLAHWFTRIPVEYGPIDTDTGITLNICGWALWAAGHLA